MCKFKMYMCDVLTHMCEMRMCEFNIYMYIKENLQIMDYMMQDL